MATAAAVVTAVGTVYNIHEQRVASRDQQKAARIERRRQQLADARARRRAVAQANQQRASLRAEAASKGASQSSAVQGAAGSIFSQTAEAVGFSYGQEAAALRAGVLQSSANRAVTRGNIAQAVAGLPAQVGIKPSFASVFGSDNTGDSNA